MYTTFILADQLTFYSILVGFPCLNLCRVFLRQVAKVEYIRRRPKLREVHVKLEDHVECMCMNKLFIKPNADTDNGEHASVCLCACALKAVAPVTPEALSC